ncbi:MAG TPA: DUF1572 family protein [Vicinamibacterales bacterium]|nr:DUF1572 family protein [Vicinamibacterales bacterium]
MDAGAEYIRDLAEQFGKLKALADKAIARVSDDELFREIDRTSNSIAIIMQHVGGNLRSRWLNFLTADGEKPDRNRDAEFEAAPGATRAQATEKWETGWRILQSEVRALTPADLIRDVFIRGERHSVIQAANRSLQHTAYHVGQIVFLARHFHADDWESLSLPRRR